MSSPDNSNRHERIIRNAWIERVILGAFLNPEALGAKAVRAAASKRDPLIDPRVGDVIALPSWRGRPWIRFKVQKRYMMRERGKRDFFGRKIEHINVKLEDANGNRVGKGHTYRLTTLQYMFAADGCAVLEYGR